MSQFSTEVDGRPYRLNDAQRVLIESRSAGAMRHLVDLCSDEVGDAERDAALAGFLAAIRDAGDPMLADAVGAAHVCDDEDGWEAALQVIDELGVAYIGMADEVDRYEGDRVRGHEVWIDSLALPTQRLAA